MFDEITRWDSLKVQNKCPVRTNDVATYAAIFRPGHCWFRGPGSENTLGHHEKRPSHQFPDGECDKVALRMIDKLDSSNHPVFKCSNMLKTSALMNQMKGGVGTHFKKPHDCAVGDQLPHHKLPVCAVGDHVLPESREEDR